MNIKGHAAFECGKLYHNLDLAMLGKQYDIKLHPKKWSDDMVKFVGAKAASLLDAGKPAHSKLKWILGEMILLYH